MMLMGINHGMGLGATSHSMGLGATSHSMGLGAISHSMGLGNANFWPVWLLPAVVGGVAVGLYMHHKEKRASRPVMGLGRFRRRRYF